MSSKYPNRILEGLPVTSPTPEEIITARTAVGITQTRAGEIVCSSLRTWQQWEAGDRSMSPGLWELFLIKTNPPACLKNAEILGRKTRLGDHGQEDNPYVEGTSFYYAWLYGWMLQDWCIRDDWETEERIMRGE